MDVRTSVERPRFDAHINVDGFLNIVECARRYHVRRILFVSSGGVVYGEPDVPRAVARINSYRSTQP